MRIFFLGASPFIINLSKQLVALGHQVNVISNTLQFNKPTENNNTIREYLNTLSVKTILADKELAIEHELANQTLSPDIVISYGAPWILSKNTITKVFDNKIINVHGTHLPKYRGGTLFSWQILTGQKTGMCLLHQLSPEIDAGPILAYKEFIYPAHCRKPIDYITEYEKNNHTFLIGFIEAWSGWPDNLKQQPEYLSSYFPRLMAPVHGWINWTWSNIELEKFILAFDEPYGGARCKMNGQTVIIRDVYAQQTDGYTHPFQHGLIYRNNGEWITVATKDGELLVKTVLNENGENMVPNIKVGDKLYTTDQELNQTHQRVVKTKTGLGIK
jgi:methionyl-tRNA formyltransferase